MAETTVRAGDTMIVSIKHPEVFTIRDEASGQSTFGGDQAWYAEDWHRMAGCGPTCAANLTAYLALTRPAFRALYAGEDMRRDHFAAHMEAVFTFVTPGNMGLNRVEMYTRGVEEFAASRGLSLKTHVFEAHGNMHRNRFPAEALSEFVRSGLASDCPVAFLNLTKGRVKNIQAWHWITLTKADVGDGQLIAWASDEGREISFDLKLWYLSTRMRGGLVYFSEN